MNVIISIISIVLSILSLFGLIFLTQLDFSNNKLTISKITLVLVWIQLILSLVITIYAMGAASN